MTDFSFYCFMFCALAFALFMQFRNNRVHAFNMWVLNDHEYSVRERLDRFHRLPGYYVMWWQLWRFTWHDYLDQPQEETPR